MRVVINRCFGGFGLSAAAEAALASRGRHPNEWGYFTFYNSGEPGDIPRHDPILVDVVEELGDKADGPSSKLKVIDIPLDRSAYAIEEYDGVEKVVAKYSGSWS